MFRLRKGESATFALQWDGIGSEAFGPPPKHAADLKRALARWSRWAERCRYSGPARELVMRSLLTLKALMYEPTGGMVAAPTTSLPETIGGVRNWDYRYCWVRDSTYTLYALLHAGYESEARAWRRWLMRAAAGSPERLNIMYGIGGEHRLPELELDWLSGYDGSRPVRQGNAAYKQRQLDIFGELMDALQMARANGVEAKEDAWDLQRQLLDFLESEWRKPDEGIWESRGPKRHYVHSKVMAWVAFDRGVRAVENWGLSGDASRWARVRDEIHAEACAKGFNPRLNSFTQSYGSKNVDASLLMLPAVGFLPPRDPRILGTIARVERDLVEGGFVTRYERRRANDGVRGQDAAFLACSFWLVDAYVLAGQRRKARALFKRAAGAFNDVGLASEEYDVKNRRMLGNFPQALTHLSLVNSAFSLQSERGPAQSRRSR